MKITTKKPIKCFNCGKIIPKENIEGTVATCPYCKKQSGVI